MASNSANTDLTDLIGAIIIGILGGILGAGFVYANTQANMLRKQYLKT